jgi:leucyl-tRNA synthetase
MKKQKYLAKQVKIYAARELRRRQTEAERILWKELRSKKFDGIKFRRQYIIKGFIVDVYCPSRKLAIELDGAIHLNQKEADKERQEILEYMGVRVLRFKNEEVIADRDRVLSKIRGFILSQTCDNVSPLLRSRRGARGEV